MWSFEGDADMEKKGRIAGSAMGRFLYRWANLSLRVIAPSAYADKRRLTPEIHRMYLDRFPDRWSREAVLWTLARSLLQSSGYYDTLWRQRDGLRGRPALIVWGMKDSAFRPHVLARWREALPSATVVEIADAGHWPHEEQPDRVVKALKELLAKPV
jgi:haloalkane dehalogenase